MSKHEKARSYLRARLLLLQEGEALPGIRNMCAESGLGRQVLERQLAAAEKEGLLICKKRSGFYRTSVAEKTGALSYALLIMCQKNALDPVGTEFQPSYANRVILELFEVAQRCGAQLQICHDEKEIDSSSCGLFLLSPGNPEKITHLESRFYRTVSISGCGGRVGVFPPYGKLTRSALEYLAGLGHRQIAIVQRDPGTVSSINPHLFEYYRFMAENGWQAGPGFIASYPDEERCRRELRMMFQHPQHPTALITPGCWYQMVCEVLRELKLNIPIQVSVVVIGAVLTAVKDAPPPTVVEESPELLGRAAWKLMQDFPDTPLQLNTEFQLIPGKSCIALVE